MLSSDEDRQAIDGVHHEANAVAVLTCPRCGRVDRISHHAWAAWKNGVRCGLCGPPYVLMEVRIVVEDSRSARTMS